jgi:sec-independent protein translocase protein TatB
MFDVGFSELVVIGLVALIVIGPERLPKVARTAGHLLGRLQRYVSDVKADINREMQLEELKKLQEQVAGEARDMEKQVNEQMATVDASLNNSILQGLADNSDPAAAAAAMTELAPPVAQSAAPATPVLPDKPA